MDAHEAGEEGAVGTGPSSDSAAGDTGDTAADAEIDDGLAVHTGRTGAWWRYPRRHQDIRVVETTARCYRDKLPPMDQWFAREFQKNDVTDHGDVDLAIWHLIWASKLFDDVYAYVYRGDNDAEG